MSGEGSMSADAESRARREILARIRTALIDVRGSQVKVPREYRTRLAGRGAMGEAVRRADVVALFTERVADYRANVRHTAADDLGTAVAAALWGREAKRVAVPADLPFGWLAELDGVQTLSDSPPLENSVLDEVDGVITGCSVAIAETGTIVLDNGRVQGRRALTLVPDYHLCVVHADQIVGTVPEAIARLDPYQPLTWISGPSATSDIELDRVEGVHGPRALDVLVVED
jgi:L-lactate dehydrogenase complex protein LldG